MAKSWKDIEPGDILKKLGLEIKLGPDSTATIKKKHGVIGYAYSEIVDLHEALGIDITETHFDIEEITVGLPPVIIEVLERECPESLL